MDVEEDHLEQAIDDLIRDGEDSWGNAEWYIFRMLAIIARILVVIARKL